MKLTIFTPTYNRAGLLHRVYESLKRQKNSDFEWVIVDDGSSDNTLDVVSEFINNSSFPIRYIVKENGGKHTAFNKGVDVAAGELFLCLDSDDVLSENAVEEIVKAEKLKENQCGYLAFKTDFVGTQLGYPYTDSNNEIKCKDVKPGEYTFIFRTDLLKKYKYPVFPNERFIGESVVYDRFALDGYSYQLLSKVIEVCEYQIDGLTNNLNRIMKSNPAGYCLYFMQRIDMVNSWKERVVTAGKYHCFCLFAKAERTIYCGRFKVLVRAMKPLGSIFWLYYKIVRGF